MDTPKSAMESPAVKQDCGCKGSNDSKTSPVGNDFERIGRQHFLVSVQSAAREALAALPDEGSLRSLNAPGREIYKRLEQLYSHGASALKWSDSEILDFARELGWVKVVMDLQVASRMKNDGGGGGYDEDCNKVYDTCMEQSGCTHSFICICCIPCSIKYSRCVLGTGIAGKGSIFMA
ncbi:MAG: hypothetical protein V4671_11570 [Armatimonadota bacterium]